MMVALKSLLLIVLCRTTGAASSTIYWVHGLNMSVGIDSDDGTLTKINVRVYLGLFLFLLIHQPEVQSSMFVHADLHLQKENMTKNPLHWPQVAALLRDMCISLS